MFTRENATMELRNENTRKRKKDVLLYFYYVELNAENNI